MISWIGCPDSNFSKGRPFGLLPEAVVVHSADRQECKSAAGNAKQGGTDRRRNTGTCCPPYI